MSTLRKSIAMLRREDGATAVEYGIMVALIAAVIVAVVIVLGNQVNEGLCDASEGIAEAESIEQAAPDGCEPAG